MLPNGCNISDYITATITGNYAIGQCLYDTSLNKPKWWNGTIWVTTDLTDTSISKKGTTASRPTLTSSDFGFMYYDTDLSKYIVWSGSAWTNMDGTALLASTSALTMSFNHLEEVPASEDKTS